MANVKISELTDAGAITGTEEIPVVQGGVTKRATVAEIVGTHEADTTGVHGISNTANLATQTDITNAVNALIGGAPGALDTLNELAAALGDDSDFAASVTTALAGKATTDSLATHAADSSSVHGVADMAALLTEVTHAEVEHSAVGVDLSEYTTTSISMEATGNETAARLAASGSDSAVSLVADGSGGVVNITAAAAVNFTDSEGALTLDEIRDRIQPVVTANRQTASYILDLTDAGKVVEMNVGSANTLTVPPNSDEAFAIGTIIEFAQWGAGQTTLTPGSGVTIRSSGGKLKTAAQYGQGSLRKVGTNEWIAAGDLAT